MKLKNVFKLVFSGVGIFFIGILVLMTLHDTITCESSNTAEYCAKYGLLASRGCW